MAKTAVICTNNERLGSTGHLTGVHLVELCHIVFELERAEHTVDICSLSGGNIPIDPNTLDMSDPIVRDYYERYSSLHRLEHSRLWMVRTIRPFCSAEAGARCGIFQGTR